MKIVTFGEIMMRLSPPDFELISQSNELRMTFGGGEANVAASLANWGEVVEFVTTLPSNVIGEACLRFLHKHYIETGHIYLRDGRIGLYIVEQGAAQRPSKVIYDRENSAFAVAPIENYNWSSIFKGSDWFHWSGITPAVSEQAWINVKDAIKEATAQGARISCDMNYRKKLWKWGPSANNIMPELISGCDVLIGNEEDAEKVLGIKAPNTDISKGLVDSENYRYVLEEIKKQYPNLRTIAITLRGSISATHNRWSAIMQHDGKVYESKKYDIDFIVDRIGSGDAFSSGLIYGLCRQDSDPQTTLEFATGAAVLKHSILGDFNLVSVDDVKQLISGDGSGRVLR